MPERNKEIGASSHAFPTKECHQQVLTQHQHQHGEDEQVQVHEELGELCITVHVSDGIQVNERTNSSDEESHRDAERVSEQCHIYLKATDRDPREQRDNVLALFRWKRQELEIDAGNNDER